MRSADPESDEVELGGRDTADRSLVALSQARAFKGVAVGGLLGSDFLSRYGTVTIDFTHRRLILGGKIPSGGRVDRIEVLRRAGAVAATTQVEVDNHRARFIIDTGGAVSVIDAAAAARLGLRARGS